MKKVFSFIFIFFLLYTFSYTIKAMNYGIPKTTDGTRPSPGYEYASIIENNNGFYIGPDEKECYLTFDCGYENGYTLDILDTLKKYNVKACFFITGHYLTSSTDIVLRMIEDGHIIGNHGMHHKDYSKISTNEMFKEITDLEEQYSKLTSKVMSKYVRPPEGAISKANAKALGDNGYIMSFWSLAYIDWYKDRYNGNSYSYNIIKNRIHNGAVILMHTVSKDNKMDLDDILQFLKSEYEIKKITQIA